MQSVQQRIDRLCVGESRRDRLVMGGSYAMRGEAEVKCVGAVDAAASSGIVSSLFHNFIAMFGAAMRTMRKLL